MEAAMKNPLYTVSAHIRSLQTILKVVFIVIDPCRIRWTDLYTNRYRNTMNSITNPRQKIMEHNQGWREHVRIIICFDLIATGPGNSGRDQQRLILYNQFMPQVHADFHEMGVESTFFFAPQPIHGIL